MTDQQLISKLDHLIALYELVNSEALAAARSALRADPTTSAILARAEDWIPAGKLKSEIAGALSTSEKTVQRRVSELVDRRALVSQRADGGILYKSTGVV